MKFNPGDIVFKSEDSSHPCATTYHVEMLTGYVCYRFDKNGEPWIEPLWATRDSDYGAEEERLWQDRQSDLKGNRKIVGR